MLGRTVALSGRDAAQLPEEQDELNKFHEVVREGRARLEAGKNTCEALGCLLAMKAKKNKAGFASAKSTAVACIQQEAGLSSQERVDGLLRYFTPLSTACGRLARMEAAKQADDLDPHTRQLEAELQDCIAAWKAEVLIRATLQQASPQPDLLTEELPAKRQKIRVAES